MVKILALTLALLVTPAMALDEQKLDRAIELMEKAVENAKQGKFLTNIYESCPADAKPPYEGYLYSPKPETQAWCTANPCHCL